MSISSIPEKSQSAPEDNGQVEVLHQQVVSEQHLLILHVQEPDAEHQPEEEPLEGGDQNHEELEGGQQRIQNVQETWWRKFANVGQRQKFLS